MKRRLLSIGMCLGLSAAMSGLGCNPTPDYRVAVLDIPASAGFLLIGWKSEEGNRASKTSLVVPLAGLGAEARARYVVGVDLLEAPGGAGVISVGTADAKGCLLSVASSSPTEPSSRASVRTMEVELDPAKNPSAVLRDPVPSPTIQCSAVLQVFPYPPQVECQLVPGLDTKLAAPALIPTKPVVINTIRELRGPARVYDSGKFAFYGWGFDSPTIEFGPNCDPSGCGPKLVEENQAYQAALLTAQNRFGFPSLRPISYSQLELDVQALKSAVKVEPSSGLQDKLIQCIAVSAASFKLTNFDGSTANYAEVLHK